MIQRDLPFPAPEAPRCPWRDAPRWRPILTAPRVEGRPVLLFGHGVAFVGYWSDDPHGDPYARRPGWRPWRETSPISGATHWIPIPEAPK